MDFQDLCINCFKPTGGEEVCMNCGFIQSDRPRQACHLFPKSTLNNNRYIIGTVINNGGFGVVYKAYDRTLDTVVAIKELLPTQNGYVTRMENNPVVMPLDAEKDAQFAQCKSDFIEEAQTIASFGDCDSIVMVKDCFEENNTVYYVMEYLEGLTLTQYLRAIETPFAPADAVEFMRPIFNALQTIHSAGKVHCDVCPDNIFVTDDGKVKLIDFGEVCNNNQQADSDTTVLRPGFSSPGRYGNEPVTYATDIYSLGAVIYNMITGEKPIDSIDRLKKDYLQAPSKKVAGVLPFVDKTIMKAMALKSNGRFSNMEDFVRAIDGKKKVLDPESEKKLKKTISAISVVMVVLLVGIGVGVTYLIQKANTLIPDEKTTIDVWYVENEIEDQEENWKELADDFSDYSAQQEDGKAIEVVFKGVSAEDYAEEYKKAKKNGEAPDVFISDYTPVNSDKKSDVAFSIKTEVSPLKMLYKQVENDSKGKDTGFTKAYDVMQENYEESDKFAVMSDLPVLYVSNAIAVDSAKNMSLQSLIDTELADGYDYSLVANPNVVYDAAFAYGYEKPGDSELELIYGAASATGNPIKKFEGDSNAAVYYLGYLSEYREIEERYSALKSFNVMSLPGGKNNYIFPEVWSVSAGITDNEHKASMLFLYYLLSNESSQKTVTKNGLYPYYLPMLQGYIDNSFIRKTAYENVLQSENEVMANGLKSEKRFNKSKEIADLAKDKAEYSRVEEIL